MIVVKDLTFTYSSAKEPAVKDVNLKIEEGEFVLFLGPTGCGKTTLCRCLNGLIPHFYRGHMMGYVKINGLDTRKHPVHSLALKVGLVFQNPEEQMVALTVEREIAFGLENLAVPRREMIKKLEKISSILEIKHLMKRRTDDLSGGEVQKVAIGAILVTEPSVLILDEPTANLDPQSVETLAGTIKRLNRKEGITVILTEHRLDHIIPYVGRVVLMNKGRILMDGEPREVLSSINAEETGIYLPRIIELYKKLKKKGVVLAQPPISIEEFYEFMRGYIYDSSGERMV